MNLNHESHSVHCTSTDCSISNSIKTKTLMSLLVGDGNFSYSAALAEQYAKENVSVSEVQRIVVATDWKPDLMIIDDLVTLRNIQRIRDLGGFVSTNTDATKLEEDEFLQRLILRDSVVDQVIFNFPHVQTKKMHIGKNRELLRKFFMSVSKLIPDQKKTEGELTVKVSLCNGQSGVNEVETVSRLWADSWQIVEQAAHGGFVLTKVDDFHTPGSGTGDDDNYVNCGFRNRLNTSFDARDAKTFNFIWRPPFAPIMSNSLAEILPQNWTTELLHSSHPIRILVNELNALQSEKVIIEHEVSCSSDLSGSQFISLWIKNVSLSSLIQKFPSICQDSVRDDAASLRNPVTKLILATFNIEVGYVRNDKAQVNISKLFNLMYNIDSRVLFSKYCQSDFSTGSLYPRPFSIDISFWINSSSLYNTESFIECCIGVYGLSLESVKLIEVYKKSINPEEKCDNDSLSTKVSHCYRITIKSIDVALSSSKSHELYLKLREVLQNKLDLELRYIRASYHH